MSGSYHEPVVRRNLLLVLKVLYPDVYGPDGIRKQSIQPGNKQIARNE